METLKDYLLEYYLLRELINRCNKLNSNILYIYDSDIEILKQLDNTLDFANNGIITRIFNKEKIKYSELIELSDLMKHHIYNDYGILL